MKIERIYAIEHGFDGSSGPTETITLGLHIDTVDVILGVYYFGPGTTVGTREDFLAMCKVVDHIVEVCNVRKD